MPTESRITAFTTALAAPPCCTWICSGTSVGTPHSR